MKIRKLLTAVGVSVFVMLASQSVIAGGDQGDTAYTNWAIVFNNSAACVQLEGEAIACGEDDLGRPAVQAAVIFLTGQRVQSNGRVVFAGAVAANSTHRQIGGPSPAGLLFPETAEIHVGILPHPDGSLATAASTHTHTTTPVPGDFAQAAIFTGNQGMGQHAGIVVENGNPVAGASATIDRVTTGVTISINTRIKN